MIEASTAIENAMRDDFARLDEVTQTRLIDTLAGAGPRHRDWWHRMLVAGPRHRDTMIWQHLFGQNYERIRPASLNPAGVM